MDYLPSHPVMLVSSINMLLRDGEYDSLEAVCCAFDKDYLEMRDTLAREGYYYDDRQRQLKEADSPTFPVLSSSMHKEELTIPFALAPEWLQTHQVVAVLTGGTEQIFLQQVQEGKISLESPIYILASRHSNSLAASLEILSWIQQHGGKGQVLTSPNDLLHAANYTPIPASYSIPRIGAGLRLGVIGRPSDWLIASQMDYAQIEALTGIKMLDIPIEEVSKIGEVEGGVDGAERIYQQLKELVQLHHLDGITLRCFDLLSSVKNTGCMALSHLNDEGIPASCEGDIPLLMTMMLARQITGEPGFQVNPAEIHADGRMLFAHCTIPLKMTQSHSLTTHFESGIGIGIHGELPLGDYTLLKLSADLKTLLAEDVCLTANQYAANLCRTQVWLQGTPDLANRLLHQPLANHHLLIRGHHAKKFL